MRRVLACVALLLAFHGSAGLPSARGAPKDPENYRIVDGLVDIPYGSVIEGSHRFGGMQPDYLLSADDPGLKNLIRYARRTREMDLPYWKKIERIIRYVSGRALPKTDYDTSEYIELMATHRNSGEDVALGQYVSRRAGVCRENALLTHIALMEAGIPNYHAYAQIRRISNFENYDLVEDHAFTVVEHDDTLWIVDSYNDAFNGFALEDVMSKDGITKNSRASPIAHPQFGYRKILKINDFPKIHVPKNSAASTLDIKQYFRPPKSQPCKYYFRNLRPD